MNVHRGLTTGFVNVRVCCVDAGFRLCRLGQHRTVRQQQSSIVLTLSEGFQDFNSRRSIHSIPNSIRSSHHRASSSKARPNMTSNIHAPSFQAVVVVAACRTAYPAAVGSNRLAEEDHIRLGLVGHNWSEVSVIRPCCCRGSTCDCGGY